MKNIIYFILICIFLSGCNNQKIEYEPEIISDSALPEQNNTDHNSGDNIDSELLTLTKLNLYFLAEDKMMVNELLNKDIPIKVLVGDSKEENTYVLIEKKFDELVSGKLVNSINLNDYRYITGGSYDNLNGDLKSLIESNSIPSVIKIDDEFIEEQKSNFLDQYEDKFPAYCSEISEYLFLNLTKDNEEDDYTGQELDISLIPNFLSVLHKDDVFYVRVTHKKESVINEYIYEMTIDEESKTIKSISEIPKPFVQSIELDANGKYVREYNEKFD